MLALNPDNVQARAELRWLGGGVPTEEDTGIPIPEAVATDQSSIAHRSENGQFMTPAGCVYCGLSVAESDARCPHCSRRLTTRHFKKEERSPLAFLLHTYWILLAGINLADFFLVGHVWENLGQLSWLVKKFLPYVTGPAVTGGRSIEAGLDPAAWVQIARIALLTLAVLGGLDALGLFFRRPMAHSLGLGLIAVHLVVGVALFILGFLGYVMVAFRGVLTVMLTVFMFNTVEDFSKVQRRERLEPDRHLLNDLDFFARGRYYERRGMWAKALLHWRRAAAMNPDRDTYYAATARALARLGHYDQAVAQIDEALEKSRTPAEWQSLRDIIVEAQRRSNA